MEGRPTWSSILQQLYPLETRQPSKLQGQKWIVVCGLKRNKKSRVEALERVSAREKVCRDREGGERDLQAHSSSYIHISRATWIEVEIKLYDQRGI